MPPEPASIHLFLKSATAADRYRMPGASKLVVESCPVQFVSEANKMKPTNPNAHTHVNGTDVKTRGYAVTHNTYLQCLFEQSSTCFPCYQSAVWSGKCRVWSVECEVRSVECKVWSGECRVRSVKCGVRSVECEVRSVKCGVRSVEFVNCSV